MISKAVWRLRGSTNNVVECSVDQTASLAHAVRVVLGSETFLYETYPDATSATQRAMHLRETLLKNGGWTLAAETCRGSTRSQIRGAS